MVRGGKKKMTAVFTFITDKFVPQKLQYWLTEYQGFPSTS